jgi:hypothetical protein
MPLIALNPGDRVTYHLHADAERETPFSLCILPPGVFTRLVAGLKDYKVLKEAGDLQLADIVAAYDRRAGLRGWSNLRMRRGEELVAAPFEADDEGKPTPATLDRLRIEWVAELAIAILDVQTVSEDDKGKS